MGWDKTVTGSRTHASCYATGHSVGLPHIRQATLLDSLGLPSTRTSCYVTGRSLGLPHVMLRYFAFSWASTRRSCYAAVRSLLGFQACIMLRYWMLSWTSTDQSCYATVPSLGLPRARHATQCSLGLLPRVRSPRFLMKWALRSYVHDDQVDERNDDDDDDHDDGGDDDDDEVDATLWLSDGACMRVRVNLHMN